MADTQEPTASHTHNNTQYTKTYNIVSMVPPSRRLPAAPILQVSAIAVRRAINHDHRNTKHGDVTFIDKTNCSFYFIHYNSTGSGLARLFTKGEFYKLLLLLFWRTCIKTTQTNSAIRQYFICQYPTSNIHVSA
jgi:hypothetical protein